MKLGVLDLPMKAQVLILMLAAILVAQGMMVAAVIIVPPPKRQAYFLSDIAEVLATPSAGARFERPIHVRDHRTLPKALTVRSAWDADLARMLATTLGVDPTEVKVTIMRRPPGWGGVLLPPGSFAYPRPEPVRPFEHGASPAPGAPFSSASLARMPFGQFVAAIRQADGTWRVAAPAPGHEWAFRILVWIVAGLVVMGPIAWWFADGITRPLRSFARAAEQLGSDPTAPAIADQGPAEVGAAARAFNDMQSRLNRYVVDRLGMMGAISHDLRTPLTRIRFKIESVKEPTRSDVLDDVQHMENMIDLVLGFIRGLDHAAPRAPLDLSSLVSVAVEDAALMGHEIEFLDPDGVELAVVEADLVALRNVLDNLLQNAIKYGDRAEVDIVRGDREATVRIQDFGPGLPATELEKVFLPFYRVEHPGRDAPGVGLGLATARSVVRAHGGDVVLSNTASGLLARMILPLKTDS